MILASFFHRSEKHVLEQNSFPLKGYALLEGNRAYLILPIFPVVGTYYLLKTCYTVFSSVIEEQTHVTLRGPVH